MKIKVEGFRELERQLSDLVDQVGGSRATGKNVLRRVLIKAAKPVEAAAAANAPILSGDLRADVKTGSRLNSRQARQARKAGKSTVEIHVGTSNPAGIQNEFGNVHQPARPWFRPAWDANSSGSLDIIRNEMGPEIDKAAARIARKAARRAG